MRFAAYEILAHRVSAMGGFIAKARHPEIAGLVFLRAAPPPPPDFIDLLRGTWPGSDGVRIAELRHPNLEAVHEAGWSDQGAPFVASEYLDGVGLDALVRRRAGILLENKLRLAIAFAEALDLAHRMGCLHLALRPAELLVTTDGMAKVLGLAKLPNVPPSAAGGRLIGYAQYMAPEQIEGKAADARTDVYALGSVLHELLSFARPFAAEHLPDLLFGILHKPHPPCPGLPPGIADGLQPILDRCLAKDPASRQASMGELAAELGGLLRDRSGALQAIDGERRAELEDRLDRARSLLDERRFDEAAAAIQEALGFDPVHVPALALAKRIAAERGAAASR